MIKFWAFIYRLTGWMSPWARVAEYEEVWSRLNEHYDNYRTDAALDEEDDGFILSFQDYVGISVRLWQVRRRFYRTSKQAEADLEAYAIWKRSHIWWR